MTELVVAKTTGATVAVAVVVALIDPAVQSIVVAAIGAVVAVTTIVFGYKTAALNKKLAEHDVKITEVIKTSDGMKDALVRVTGESKLAEGILRGKSEERATQAVIDKATLQAHQETGNLPP